MSTQMSMKNNARQMWADGGMIFAAVLLVIVGIFQIFEGIAAISLGGTFIDPTGFAYSVNNTAFGWIHLIVGIIVVAAGLALFTGRLWARALAIALAVVSLVANFFYLPFQPVWSLVIIALDVFVIWACANARAPRMTREEAERTAMGAGYVAGYEQGSERWPENVAEGRGWAPDTKQPAESAQQAQQQAQERANAAARGGGSQQNPPRTG